MLKEKADTIDGFNLGGVLILILMEHAQRAVYKDVS